MDKIEVQNKTLFVPEYPTIPVITGDATGKEIWTSARLITGEALKKCYADKRAINWLEVNTDENSFRKTKKSLPDEIMNVFNTYYAGIVCPKDIDENKSYTELLRYSFDLYARMKHFRWINGIKTPLRNPQNIDITVFREYTEDIYAGVEWKFNTDDGAKFLRFLQEDMQINKIRFPKTSSLGIKAVSKDGCERVVQSALDYAIKTNASKLTIVHNSYRLPMTEGAFVDWAYDLVERSRDAKILSMRRDVAEIQNMNKASYKTTGLPPLIVEDLQIGEFMKQMLSYPEKFDVVVTLNLDGDIMDHFLTSISGNDGIVPFGNINGHTGRAVFGYNRDVSIDIAGLNKANPTGMILACSMLLEYIKWNEASELIRKALERVIAQGKVTGDLSHNFTSGVRLTTEEFTQEVITMIRNI
ncbi:MAG: isocitrate/isopropylmalate family dehydrogenase [Bacteroidales bacterium]